MSDGTNDGDGPDDRTPADVPDDDAWVDAYVASVREELERDIFAEPEPVREAAPARVPKGRRKRVEPKSRVLKLRELHAARAKAMPLFENVRDLPLRPRTRADCVGAERPCPWVGCAYNLYLDVGSSGSIKLNFPDREPDGMTSSCALDVAERGGMTLDDVGALINVTRERARQTESIAMYKVELAIRRDRELFEHVEPEHRRRLPLYGDEAAERFEATLARLVARQAADEEDEEEGDG